jgi:hypothetical protein
MEIITTQSLTLVTLLCAAIDRVPTQTLFDRDPYESRRTALKGSRLLKVLAFFQLCAPPSARGLLEQLEHSAAAQKALGGTLARNTLSNALAHYDLDLMVEAWLLLHGHYSAFLPKLGQPFARITAKAAAALTFCAHWTYIFDRGYFGFDFLQAVANAGAHFMVRFKRHVKCQIVSPRPWPTGALPAGVKELILDALVTLPGWETQTTLRLVMYQLMDGKVISVLTTRQDLCALSIVRLYKERWTLENWWRWIKRLYQIKEPLGESENALPLQIVAAFIADLLL